jgi:putative sigma-54 modulation protein
MRIDVVGRNVEVTEAIKAHAVDRASKVEKFFDRIQLIAVTLSKKDHHTHGDYGAEIRVDVEGHDDFVGHATNADLYAAIDDASQKVSRQIREYKSQLKPGHHH